MLSLLYLFQKLILQFNNNYNLCIKTMYAKILDKHKLVYFGSKLLK